MNSLARQLPAVRACLRDQSGLMSRAQAVAAGLTARQVDDLVKRREWVAVRRGWYADRGSWDVLDPWVGRPLLEARAVLGSLGHPHVLSHDSAAALWGLPTLRPATPLVHVTRLGPPRARTRNGVRYHQSPVVERHLRLVDGLPVLDLARTAVDIAREHGIPAGVAAIDAARQRGIALDELWQAVEPMWRWPRVITARHAIVLSDGGAESVGESLARLLVSELGIGPIQTQFELVDNTGYARCDMRVGRHVFEFDGRLKYRRRDRGGVADRDPEQVLWDEKVRQDWVCGHRLGMSRIVWADFWGERRRLALQRLASEYAATCSLFGTSVADLGDLVVRPAS